MIFERLKLLAKDEFGCEIVRSKEKSSFAELFKPLDPEAVQKLHELRRKVPLYFEPFELLQREDDETVRERQGPDE